jgi:hydroxymethylbilane synthase
MATILSYVRQETRMKETFRVGTRKSALALWQTKWVVECLRKINPEYDFEICTFQTQGDEILDVALSKIGDKGLFTKELEQALLSEEIDFAVHSLKDMPSTMPEGLCLGAICKREKVEDVLVSRGVSFADLPRGAKVGTSSLRRSAQLLAARPDLRISPLRGNVETRLRKLDTEGYDAIVLAAAGIIRLELQSHVTEYLSPDICLPAVGQGAVTVECRSGDQRVLKVLEGIDDFGTRLETTAERSLMRELEGGCQVPLAALAMYQVSSQVNTQECSEEYTEVNTEVNTEVYTLTIDALVAQLDGKEIIRTQRTMVGSDTQSARELGILAAQDLRKKGADEILKEIRLEPK